MPSQKKYRIEFAFQITLLKMFLLFFVFVQLSSAHRCVENHMIHLLDCENLNLKNVPHNDNLASWVEAINFYNNNVSRFDTTWLLLKFPHVRRIDLHKNPLRCIPMSAKVIILSDCDTTNHPSTRLCWPKTAIDFFDKLLIFIDLLF